MPQPGLEVETVHDAREDISLQPGGRMSGWSGAGASPVGSLGTVSLSSSSLGNESLDDCFRKGSCCCVAIG